MSSSARWGKTQVLLSTGDDSHEGVCDLGGSVVGRREQRIIAPDLDGDGRGELIWWTQDNPGQVVVYERVLPAAALPWDGAGSFADRRLPLLQGFPDPFAEEAVIRYEVPRTVGSPPVLLRIFDSNGRRIRTLTLGLRPAGTHGLV